MASNTLWQQSEVVRTKLFPFWAEADFMVLSDFINKGEVEIVGERDYRIPFKITFGGRMGHYDNQLGDMGRGSSPQGNVMLQSFYSMRLNFERSAPDACTGCCSPAANMRDPMARRRRLTDGTR